ncbi:hypothetical protein DE146DRAFT_152599 [Phaeosphaeria sp. MPI-PUGE-AT-0046c]|nr:hypothetical protein DE146DRAFT_152599 [Phaeosphaeria sp. MPI-PUGE-AT-0046c]
MTQSRVVVRIHPGCSDGDPLHVPKQGGHYTRLDPPILYMEKIAEQWMNARREARPGIRYILDALPYGYTLWQRPRPSDPRHVDKYLFGHPQQKYYDSPNRFYPHFEHLMENGGSSIGCQCKLCAGSAGVLPRSLSNSVRGVGSSCSSSSQSTTTRVPKSTVVTQLEKARRGRTSAASATTTAAPAVQARVTAQAHSTKGSPKLIGVGVDTARVDEEGTPDVYRNLIDKLHRHKTVDEILEEPLSADWRAEQMLLPKMLQNLQQQNQWIPRVGEIVLYLHDLPSGVDIMRHENTGEYQMYDEESEDFLGTPEWEAGLVGEVPAEALAVADLHRSDSDSSVIYSGFRIEPLPNPNEANKSLSKRYKYVSCRQIRPFVLWKELLEQVPQKQWHPTVVNALTLSSTLSLMGKYRFRGTWPNAIVYCHGIHLGSELLVVGDSVRLLPSASKMQTRCTEIMVIKTIRLKWSNLDAASNNDYDEGRPYNTETFIYGSAYSSDPAALNKAYMSDENAEPPKAAAAYGKWYPLHPTSKELAVPFTRIAGRLYDRDAMSFWLNSDPDDRPSLDHGREGLLEARAFARNNDERISKEPGATWYWGDNRAEALNLQTVNGVDVTKYQDERDPQAMRKNIKVLNGAGKAKGTTPRSAAPATFGDSSLRRFMAPSTVTLPERVRGSSMSDNATTSSSMKAGKKRPHVINLSDEENAIRQSTRIVSESASASTKKKARVTVVVKGK